MVKTASKYILSLSILLLGGYGHLFAYSVHDSFATDASVKEQIHVGVERNIQKSTFSAISSRTEKEKRNYPFDFAEEEEVEENKESSSKKLLEISDFYAVLLDTKQALFYCHFIKSRLLFCERSSYFSSEQPLNVEFEVFLI